MKTRQARPFYTELHFPFVGPVMIRDRVRLRNGVPIESNYEAACHLCYWHYYENDHNKLRQTLLNHFWTAHNPQPKPQTKDMLGAPG